MGNRVLLIISLFILYISSMNIHAQSYDQLRKQVQNAENKGLPQTAVKLLDDMFCKAQTEKNSAEMLYAYTARAQYQEQITPDSFYVNIQGLEEWANSPVVNHVDCAILHTILAGTYAGYAAENRWQLNERTDIVGEEPSEDIREWSVNMFLEKVLLHSRMALEDSLLLLNTSTKDYTPFVVQGDASKYYGHDFYHLLSLQVANTLKGIQFVEDPVVKASIARVYDNLINTYRTRGNTEGWMLASLEKLAWQRPWISEDMYLQTLNELIAATQSGEISVEAYHVKASYLNDNQKRQEAMRLIDEVVARYPKYKRINILKSLKEEILLPWISINAPSSAYPGEDISMRVNHKNLDGFTVNFYEVNLSATSPLLDKPIDDSFYKRHTKKINSKHYKLVRPENYQNTDTTLTVTVPDLGLYLMQIVPDAKSDGTHEGILSITGLQVLSRIIPGNIFEVAVLDPATGKPVPDAQVRIYTEKKGEKKEAISLTTNPDGKIETPWKEEYRYLIADKENDTAMLMQYVRRSYNTFGRVKEATKNITLLTDRSIYRPGQTVYVKGIAYEQKSDTAHAISQKPYTLSLYDSNHREIGKQKLLTNEYGSFNTAFILPSGGLNGTYYLQTEGATTYIRVEEYKRPTFDITFDTLKTSYGLGDSVRVKGTVKTYSGVMVQEVPVQYTINRTGYGWERNFGQSKLLASGTATLNEAGEFTIPVILEIDENQNQNQNNGYYTYTVSVTVTNAAGETQSSQVTLFAGKRSMNLNLDIADRINKDDTIRATFRATNLNGMPVSVEGEYKLYPYTDYKKKTVATAPAYTGTFASNKKAMLSEWKTLPSGAYKIVVTANDLQGREVTFDRQFVLFSITDTRPVVESAVWYHPINTQFDHAHPASFIFGTSEKEAYVLMDVFTADKRLESRIILLTDSLMRFDYPYKDEYGDGLRISLCFVKKGTFNNQNVRLEKRLPQKELTMKWEVFRDKLRPGQKEEWRLTIKTPQGTPADAEMLATMYDASLDKIWPLNQELKPYYSVSFSDIGWLSYLTGMNYYSVWFKKKNIEYPQLVLDRFWQAGIISYTPVARIEFQENVIFCYVGPSIATRSTSMKMTQAAPQANMALQNEAIKLSDEETGNAILSEATPDIRTNFAETAFFYPQLRTNEQGEIALSFTMPESLTRWNFRGYAHTKGMLTGMLNGETVTSKDFMLTPNLPHFVRVGDHTSIAASVANLTGNDLSGTVTMTLFDPMTEKVISTQKQKYTVAAGKTGAVNFMFTATDAYNMLGCRLVAEGGNFSDGEQHLLPVLSNKESIIETVAMPIRGNQTREFSLQTLFNNNSKTATNRRLTVEFSGNPAWYAVQALPSVSLPVNENAISWQRLIMPIRWPAISSMPNRVLSPCSIPGRRREERRKPL